MWHDLCSYFTRVHKKGAFMDLHFDKETIKEKWEDFKKVLSNTWHKVSDMEWEETSGDSKKMSGLIQKHYGQNEVEANRSLNGVYNDFVTKEGKARMDWEGGPPPANNSLNSRPVPPVDLPIP
jgi:uncharacterized protein YjbJ (UPF0337 family)